MINKLTAGLLGLVLTVSVSPASPAYALRATTENPATLAGLEESLLGQKIRNVGRRWMNYLALAGLAVNLAQGPNLPMPPVIGAVPAAAQSPTSLPGGTVTATQLTITFPSALAGRRVGAYLFVVNDIGYLQGIQTIPANGTVTFTVLIAQNRPGWVAAADRVLAVFPTGVTTGPATAARPNAISGASLVINIALNGRVTVISGQWPAETPPVTPPPTTSPVIPSPIAQQPLNTLSSLRALLGPNRTISLYANDPTALVTDPTLAGFFSLAAQRGVDVVWISGFRFRLITEAQRRALADAAAKHAVTIGLVDGNYDWDLPQMQSWVANFYREVLGILPLIRVALSSPAAQKAAWDDLLEKAGAAAKDLPVTYMFQVDFEPYIKTLRPDWTGDLGPYLSRLIRETILPLLRAFRDAHPEHVRPGVRLLYRFEPSWLANGVLTDDGVIVSGLTEDDVTRRDTAVLSGTYGNTAAGIQQRAQPILVRVRATGMTFQIGVETIPQARSGTPSYANSAQQIPADVLEALRAMAPADFAQCDGIFVHAENPREAYRILTAWGQAPAPPADALAVSPDGRTAVRRIVSGGQTRLQFVVGNTPAGEYGLPPAFANAKLIPQFLGNNNYLFLKAETPGGDGFAVFGVRRQIPGAPTAPTWDILPLRTPQGNRRYFIDQDPEGLLGLSIRILTILPNYGPPDDDVAIGVSMVGDSTGTPARTVVLVIETGGLEEGADQFLQERRLETQAVGELA